MTIKQFTWAKIAVAAILAIVVSQAVILNSYILGIVAVIIAMLLIIILKKQVNEVLADERDYKIAGDAARWTLSIFAVGGWLISFAFIALRKTHPGYEDIGFTLSYAICALLVVHLIVTSFFRRTDDSMSKKKKTVYGILAALVAVLVVILGLRAFFGEDDWICQNGQWTAHGQPNLPAPERPCQ